MACRPTRSCLRPGAQGQHARVVGTGFRPGVGPAGQRRQGCSRSMGPRRASGARCAPPRERPGDRFGLLTGIDVALPLIARGAAVTLLSVTARSRADFASPARPAELPNVDALAAEVSLSSSRRARRGSLVRAPNWFRLATSDRCTAAPHDPAVAVVGVGDQRRFLREDLRQWDILRHRMPPTIADQIHAALDSAQLTIEAGEVADVSLQGTGVELVVTTSDGSVRRRGDAVVVATGTSWDRRSLHRSPLWSNLLSHNIASLHPSGVGVRVDPEGHPHRRGRGHGPGHHLSRLDPPG